MVKGKRLYVSSNIFLQAILCATRKKKKKKKKKKKLSYESLSLHGLRRFRE